MYVEYWKSLNVTEKQNLALSVNTSPNYLRHVMYGRKMAGFKLAQDLHLVTGGRVNKSVLRPDIYPVGQVA